MLKMYEERPLMSYQGKPVCLILAQRINWCICYKTYCCNSIQVYRLNTHFRNLFLYN